MTSGFLLENVYIDKQVDLAVHYICFGCDYPRKFQNASEFSFMLSHVAGKFSNACDYTIIDVPMVEIVVSVIFLNAAYL